MVFTVALACLLLLPAVSVTGNNGGKDSQDDGDEDAGKPPLPEKFVYILDPFLSGGFALRNSKPQAPNP